MNETELKNFLQSHKAACAEREKIRDEIFRLRCQLESPGGGRLDGMPHSSGVSDRVGTGVVRLDKLQAQHRAKSADAERIKSQIERLIAPLSSVERELMHARYILHQRWDCIAKRLHYSERHIKRLHGNILHKLADTKN